MYREGMQARGALACALIALALLASCSSGDVSGRGDRPGNSTPGAAGSASPGATGSPHAAGAGSTIPGAGTTPNPSLTPVITDRMTGGVNRPSVYTSKCPLQRGRPCVLDFTGFYDLFSEDQAFIIVIGREDGKSEPVARGGATVPRGSNAWKAQVPYQVGPNARMVTFETFMQTGDGRIIARGRTDKLEIVG